MGYQKYLLICILIILLPVAYSLSASIGNARMVLRPVVEEGKITTIDKTIQVNNVNEVPVNIKAVVSDNFKDIINLPEPEFVLEPGEKKLMPFVITLEYGGRYEGKIFIGFSSADPTSKETSVGLPSNIIIIAEGPENPNPTDDQTTEDDEVPPLEPDQEINNTTDKTLDDPKNESIDNIPNDEKTPDNNQDQEKTPGTKSTESKTNPLVGLSIIAIILAVGLSLFYLINRRG